MPNFSIHTANNASALQKGYTITSAKIIDTQTNVNATMNKRYLLIDEDTP